MDIDLLQVVATPKARHLMSYVIHDKGITIVNIVGSPFYKMDDWLKEHGGTVLYDDPYSCSRTWQVAEDIKLLFALRWA